VVEVRGLEDVVASDSSICYIDGARGILSYRGIDIHELAAKSSFEEVCHLLWAGRLPRRDELEVTRAALGRERAIPREVLSLVASLARTSTPMDALRTAVSALADSDPDVRDSSEEANRRKAVRLTGQLATVVAAFHRLRENQAVVPPDPGRAHADDFLRMIHGETARSSAVRAFDVALVLHADHGLDSSTLAARVTAATLAGMHSAVTSAVATLKGPLHGGGNEGVLRTSSNFSSDDSVLGLPPDLSTPIFAVSRIAGWTAHILEQYANNRLVRPRAEYTGPPYPQPYGPLKNR
jgi:2-methylcitrate synthase